MEDHFLACVPAAFLSASHFLLQPQSSQLASLIDWLEMLPSKALCLMKALEHSSNLIKGLHKIAPLALVFHTLCC